MNRDEAIAVLQESRRQNKAMKESPNTFFSSADIVGGAVIKAGRRIDALEMAIAALRAQQTPAKLDRNRWEAHPVIKRRPYRSEKFKEFKLSEDGEVLYRKIVTIHEDWTDDYCSACGKKLCSRFQNYCPNCGRPLTKEAWAELEGNVLGGWKGEG